MNIQAISIIDAAKTDVATKGATGDVKLHHKQMGWLNNLLCKGLDNVIKADKEQKEKAHQEFLKSIYE